jgi:tetrahydromethanopterin S-methyltransferase subunit B
MENPQERVLPHSTCQSAYAIIGKMMLLILFFSQFILSSFSEEHDVHMIAGVLKACLNGFFVSSTLLTFFALATCYYPY